MAEKKIVFGIDLGTTYSGVAYVNEHDIPTMQKDLSEGREITPSAVYITENGDISVGQSAKDELVMDPSGYVDLFKRYMGRVSEDLPEQFTLHGKTYRPEQLSAFVLQELKRSVDESSLGGEMEDVVITCPAYFSEAERMATKQAGEMAGLNVMAVIKEPLAAAIDYTHAFGDSGSTFLVYDLGGGTFDATIMAITSDSIQEVVSDGDSQLGGKDWDAALVYELKEQFRAEHPEHQLSLGEEKQLVGWAEEAKKKLTNKETTKVKINLEGNRMVTEISRQMFNELTDDLVERTLDITDALIEKAQAKGISIDTILLVGGSTRMPIIKEKLQAKYGIEPKMHDQDLAVAKGAAIWAVNTYEKNAEFIDNFKNGQVDLETLSNEKKEIIEKSEHYSSDLNTNFAAFGSLAGKEIATVATKTYGVTMYFGEELKIKNIIMKNSDLEEGRVMGQTHGNTMNDGQSAVVFDIFESDDEEEINDYVDQDLKIGTLTMEIGTWLPAGSPVEVTLTLNEEGMINAYAKELTGGSEARAEIKLKGVMTKEEVASIKEENKLITIIDEI